MTWKAKRIAALMLLSLAALFIAHWSALGAREGLLPDERLLDVNRAMAVVKELSSKTYDGRLTGTKGNELAIRFIAERFKAIGLKSPGGLKNYTQPYQQRTLITLAAPKLEIIDANGKVIKKFTYMTDFGVRTAWDGIKLRGEVTSRVVCLEAMDQFKDSKRFDGKILLLGRGIVDAYGGPVGAVNSIVRLWRSKPKGIIVNAPRTKAGYFGVSRAILGDQYIDTGPVIAYCSDKAFDELKRVSSGNLNVLMKVDFAVRSVQTANIIGVIPGTERTAKAAITVGAHLDHIGSNMDGSFNPGALDNASGVAAVMEAARVILAGRPLPKRPIVIAAFNGEEEGLCGSDYYAAHPILPLEGGRMINLDMVGSSGRVPLTTDGGDEDMRAAITTLSRELGMGLECIPTSSMMSDHRSFEGRNVSAMMLIHDDLSRVHTPADTIEYVDPVRLRDVIRLLLRYIGQVAY